MRRRGGPLARAFAAAVLGYAALASAPSSANAIDPDYSGYAMLLKQYLTRMEIHGVVVATSFDYQKLHDSGGHQGLAARLGRIRLQLLAVPPSRMTRAERLAWGINLYNFLVIQTVIDNWMAGGKPIESVKEVKDFFDRPVAEVEGTRYSLDQFERHFLFADFDRKSERPPPGLDSRVHFALVCAARGCPPLDERPYRAATLDTALAIAARSALRSPRHLMADPSTGKFATSAIFEWYERDFGGRAGVVDFLKRYGPPEVRMAIGTRGAAALAGTISWDWKLNRWTGRDPVAR